MPRFGAEIETTFTVGGQPGAAMDESLMRGSYRSAADIAARDAIPTPRRKSGMRVKVLGDDGAGVSGRVFELGADLLTWLGLLTDAEIVASIAKFGTAITTGISQSGYRYFMCGDDGKLLFGITDDAVPKIMVGDETVSVRDALAALSATVGTLSGNIETVAANLALLGAPITLGLDQSGYRYFTCGTDGGIWFGITDDAIPALEIPALNIGDTKFRNLLDVTQSGKSWVLYGADGREIGGTTDDAFPQPTGAFSVFQSARPEYVAGALFDVYTRRDTNGDMQVYSLERSTGTVRQLSTAGNGHMNIAIDAAGKRAMWSTSAADRWPSNQLRSRRMDAAFPASHLFPKKALLVSGDSVDAGSVATGSNSYASRLRDGLSLALTNRAIGGQQLWQQAMQLGAIPTYLTLPSASVGTSATAVSAISTVSPRTGATVTQTVVSGSPYPNTMLLSTTADNTTRNLSGWVIDSTGARQRATLTRTASGGPPSTTETYTVVSVSGAAITTASAVVQFIPDNADQLSYVASFGGGLNDLGQGVFAAIPETPANILADVRAVQDAVIDAIGPASPAFIIQGMYNQASAFTVAGSDADLAIIAHNNERRVKYPGRFVDRFAIFAAGGDGSANDNSDIANHWVPRSLRGSGDVIHPNDAGHGLIYNGNSGGLGAGSLLSRQLAAIPLT